MYTLLQWRKNIIATSFGTLMDGLTGIVVTVRGGRSHGLPQLRGSLTPPSTNPNSEFGPPFATVDFRSRNSTDHRKFISGKYANAAPAWIWRLQL